MALGAHVCAYIPVNCMFHQPGPLAGDCTDNFWLVKSHDYYHLPPPDGDI